MGYVGVIFIEKAFTNALSWLFGTSQLLNQCQDCSSSRCLCRCVILASDAKMSFKNIMTTIGIMVCYIHIGVRLLRCSFYIDRQRLLPVSAKVNKNSEKRNLSHNLLSTCCQSCMKVSFAILLLVTFSLASL